ncbi:TPA: tail fiber assembly protein [Citrobacter amalonaticus]|nr:tail fiber assembly protein [Citrobacter amalonaticus]
MAIFYSAITRGFYRSGNEIPSDAVEITQQQLDDLLFQQEQGLLIIPDSTGFPTAIENVKDPVESARDEKQRRINEMNEYINSRQWPGKAAIGRLTGDELAQYNLWLDYLDALEMIDTSSAPDINWPVPLEV